ncbi:molybdopterin dinucleotide binding domain-containing protein [Pseudomonas sp. F1_0610]|uniref:molybdopterin dinucleotide binding domain-containing protein n=1 Tax=Pseudomonas sp. F1_0610 TaxID=3114284 RepID=UPI0039C1EC14
MDKSRRNLLKGTIAAGGVATFAAGYSDVLSKMAKGISGSSGEIPKDRINGNSLEPEYSINPKTGELTLNPNQRTAFTVCYGCTTLCGVRVRIDNKTDDVLRVAGNPYHPLSGDPHLPEQTPVLDALKSVSAYQEQGLAGRSTACARGNAMMAQITSPFRLTHCLKRVGKRGERQWQKISFEQLVQEVCDGGDLFGEGHVQGLAELCDHDTLIDPKNPEYGPIANQLLVMDATDYGRTAILKRFAFNSFGTRNFGAHGPYCGLAFRLGYGAAMNDIDKNAHAKPDYTHTRFALFIGTAPSQAGNPFKRQGRLLAEARSLGQLEYVIVDPALTATASHAAKERNNWVPILPGTDSAFVMAIIQWLFKHEAYAAEYLSIPSAQAALAAKEAGHTNATHLVIETDSHPRAGFFLRRSDLGLSQAGAEDDVPMVFDLNNQLVASTSLDQAQLFVDQQSVTLADGSPVIVSSSLSKLRRAANEFSMQHYADNCGVNVKTIEAIAAKFAQHGRQSVADCHGGMMSATGVYASFGIASLNILAGSFNRRGGAIKDGGQFNGVGAGPRYDMASFPNMRTPKGVFLSRSKFPYAKSSEFKRKKEAGQNPYPADGPWRPLAPPLVTEHLSSGINGYPYHLKAVISSMANPLYGQAGLNNLIGDDFKDPSKINLFIGIDGFINETNRYADYLVPDSVMYEVWGFTGSWGGTNTKTTTACWPVVEPRQQKTAEGEPVTMDAFLIAVAKRLNLPGFGENAIPDAQGNLHPLNRAEDFYLRAAANVAFQGKPLPIAHAEDIKYGSVERLLPMIERTLKAEERGPVTYMYSRGGRFEDYDQAFKDGLHKHAWLKPMCLYNEELGTAIDSLTGKRYVGHPQFQEARFYDGTPMREIYTQDEWPLLAFSFKSNLMNSYAIGLERLRMIKPYNPVLLHTEDAKAFGVAHGDIIEIESPGGKVLGMALINEGVKRGAIGIEHGFGHRELGASQHIIDGQAKPSLDWVGAGVNLNDLGFADPTRKVPATWLEHVSGASIRQGLPVKVRKVTG